MSDESDQVHIETMFEKHRVRRIDVILGLIQELVHYAGGTKKGYFAEYHGKEVEGVSLHHKYPDVSGLDPVLDAEEIAFTRSERCRTENAIMEIKHCIDPNRHLGVITIDLTPILVVEAKCYSYCTHPHNGSHYDEKYETVPIEKLEKLLEGKVRSIREKAIEKAKDNILTEMAKKEIRSLEYDLGNAYMPYNFDKKYNVWSIK
jgi:hypothetical protein